MILPRPTPAVLGGKTFHVHCKKGPRGNPERRRTCTDKGETGVGSGTRREGHGTPAGKETSGEGTKTPRAPRWDP